MLAALSSVGLGVLAIAHHRAGASMNRALDEALPGTNPSIGGSQRRTGSAFPRSWLALPWLAWWRAPGVERVPNIVYTTVGGRQLKLDVYRATSRQEDCPVLVEIHGGGWITGDRRLEARPLMARMAALGWVCVSVDYRVGRRATWPDHIVDVNTALAWVREHVADYGGDPDFVAVTGGSAGGHLAALATLAPDDSEYRPLSGVPAEIRACVAFYGSSDFSNALGLRPAAEHRLLERFVVRVPSADAPATYERGNPLLRVNEDAPPFLVIQGSSDNLVFPAESRGLVDRLREVSHAPVAYAEIPRAQHAFDVFPSVRTAHVISGVERFLAHVHSAHRDANTLSTAP